MYDDYLSEVQRLVKRLEGQANQIRSAGERIAKSLREGGILHVFGSGHSHMLAEELFHRSGGLVPVNAILDPNLTQMGTVNPSQLERMDRYAEVLFYSNDVRAGEVMIIVSTSGRNSITIEMAELAKRKGLFVVGVSSVTNYAEIPSRHASGEKLADIADMTIDTGVPLGDGVIHLEGLSVPIGPTSTVLAATVMNGMVVEAISILHETGDTPPIFKSGNVPGGDDHNRTLMDRYAVRIPAFIKNVHDGGARKWGRCVDNFGLR